MAQGAVREEVRTARSVTECWELLTDVERMAGWVDIVEDVTVLEPLSRYAAVLKDEMGPFKLRADVVITVTEAEEGRRIAFQAEGDDQLGVSHLRVEAGMSLEDDGGGARILLNGTYSVTGRLATMGGALITRKADGAFDQFLQGVRGALT